MAMLSAALPNADHAALTACSHLEEVARHRLPNITQNCPEDLIREVLDNPFRPVQIERAWLSWNNDTVPKLAQTLYDERAFDRLPILADALEEAGCTDIAILEHCRGPGPHVRGCWVVDVLLGKS
jgi:hypothetical protein